MISGPQSIIAAPIPDADSVGSWRDWLGVERWEAGGSVFPVSQVLCLKTKKDVSLKVLGLLKHYSQWAFFQ